MNLKRSISLAAILVFALVSCKKSVTPTPTPPKPTSDVYVAGSAGTVGGNAVAAYWKNGVVTKLGTDSVNGSQARAIAVNNGDVYVAGVLYGPGGQITPALWKNGVLTKPTDVAGDDGDAHGVALVGSDVYVAGTIINNVGNLEGICWKNGVPITLPSSLSNSEAMALKGNGTDIYIAGDAQYDKTNNYWVATYWKNSASPTAIAATTGKSSEIFSIGVNGSDIYMAGYSNGNTVNGVPTYWKNGVATQLTDGSSYAAANGVAANSSDVVVAGVTTYNGHQVATYWKNGTAARLEDGTSTSYAGSVVLENSDTYIAEQLAAHRYIGKMAPK